MKYLDLLVRLSLILACVNSALAQHGIKVYKGDGTSTDTSIREFTKVRSLPNGDLIFLGQSDEGLDVSVSLTRTTAVGTLVWQKKYGSTGIDAAKNFALTADGGIVVVGYTDNTGSVSDFADILVFKVDTAGVLLWAKKLGGADEDDGFGITELLDNSLIITGYTYSFGSEDKNAFAAKLDANGDLVWSKAYAQGRFNYFIDAKQSTGNDVILCGYTWVLNAGSTLFDPFFVKVDADGAILWANRVKIASTQIIYDFEKDSDGGLVYAGTSIDPANTAGWNQNLIGKVDGNGISQWARIFGSPTYDRIWDLTIASNGSYLVAGYADKEGVSNSKRDGFIARLSNSGLFQQGIRFGVNPIDTNTTVFTGVGQTGDFVVAAGYTYNYANTRGAGISVTIPWADFAQNCSGTLVNMPGSVLTTSDSLGANSVVGGSVEDILFTETSNNLVQVDVCLFSEIEKPVNQEELFIFPNPASRQIQVRLTLDEPAQYSLFQSDGKQIKSGTIYSDSQLIDLEGLPSGLYQLRLQTNQAFKRAVLIKNDSVGVEF